MSIKKQDVGVANLKLPSGEVLELPIYGGSLGPNVIDISKLRTVDMFTYDPGFMSTASCSSTITFIDGEKGQLYYRGYPIEELASKSDFMEVCYLLYNGSLPNEEKMQKYKETILNHTMVVEKIPDFIRCFDSGAHPMAILVSAIGALAAFYHDWIDVQDPENRQLNATRLVAKMPTLAAMCYKHSIGQPFMYPQNRYGFVENFLHMLHGTPCEEYLLDPILIKALDKIFILHADHEQNASTSAVRLTGSTNANPFGCISAGVAALWGPAHGGANEAVLKMLQEIGDEKNIKSYIQGIKDGTSGKRLMGFGHRVYKNFDPRANVMRETCHEVLSHLGLHDDKLFRVALELEQIALQDEYFVKRKLYPNVDFYSGIVLRALQIPQSMFTAIFAIARTIGWVSHWNELHEDPEFRIGRPRQLYLGMERKTKD